MSDDEYWIAIPPDVLPKHYQPGEFLQMLDGKIVKVLAQSTSALKVRPVRWWETWLKKHGLS